MPPTFALLDDVVQFKTLLRTDRAAMSGFHQYGVTYRLRDGCHGFALVRFDASMHEDLRVNLEVWAR